MKKFLVIAIVAVFSLNAKASEKVMVSHNKTLDMPVLSVINAGNQYDNLEIKDSFSGKVIHSQKIQDKNNLHETLNFANFGVSSLTIELKGKDDVYTKDVTIVNGKVIQTEVNVNNENPDNMKVFLLDDNNTLSLSHLNPDKKTLSMEIIDLDENKKVKKDHIGRTKTYSHKYDISRLKDGVNYKVALYSGETEYHYEFIK